MEKCQVDTYNFFYYGGRVCGYLSNNMLAELHFSFGGYSFHFLTVEIVLYLFPGTLGALLALSTLM